ncbi:MAG: S49 family peptidase [Defluviimonas sp.]|uniref:S49 family peptidase n=1 Tax=Albidovulum sp. TaxID=1872424 RepID=UPI001DF3F2F9|nr:S49 family peptidase [Paracoccaceae bacterium]MCC0065116.1 S49 family peptidase [Defluviimonas sp.]
MRRFIPFLAPRPRVAVLRLQGLIASGGNGALCDAALAPMIEKAFSRGRPKAVALVINSPGGAPVQSALIAARIRRLAEKRKIPVHAFVEDVAASGGYWLATAADTIWLDESSVVGSIGVISAGFGFPEFMARHGIERRVHTAGDSKSLLDPFRPEKAEDVARLRRLLEPIHAAFKAQVGARRGTRLREGEDLFTGDVWVGQDAVDRGLADGIAHLVPTMTAIYGERVRLVPYAPKKPFFRRFGLGAVDAMLERLEERLLWSRYGL